MRSSLWPREHGIYVEVIAPQLTASWRQEYDDLSGERSASVVGRGGLIGLTGLGGEGGAVGLGAA